MAASDETYQRQCLMCIRIGFWLVGFFFREYVWIGSVGYLLRIDVGLFFLVQNLFGIKILREFLILLNGVPFFFF